MRARTERTVASPTRHLFAASLGCLLAMSMSACGSSGTKTPTDGAAMDAKPDAADASDGGAKDTATDVPTTDATSTPDATDATNATDAGTDAADAPVDMAVDTSSPDGSTDTSVDVATDGGGSDGDAGAADGDPAASDAGTDDAAGDAEAGALACDAGSVTGSHLVFQFDSKNAEWVKSVQWRDSTGMLTDNLTGYGNGPGCTAPYEFFGQSFAAPEGNAPYPVGGNNIASFTACGTDQTIVSQSPDCGGGAQTPVTTAYRFYTGAKADQVRITRTIGFDANTPKSPGVGMRVYVPRLLLSTFSDVLIPNGAGTATTTTSANSCGGDCFTQTGTTWNGKWFADVDPTSGRAMIVLRDPSMTSAVSLTVNNDNASATNLSSFVVLQPDDGWKAPLTDIYYLCFADLTTWPQSARDNATLPVSCGP